MIVDLTHKSTLTGSFSRYKQDFYKPNVTTNQRLVEVKQPNIVWVEQSANLGRLCGTHKIHRGKSIQSFTSRAYYKEGEMTEV